MIIERFIWYSFKIPTFQTDLEDKDGKASIEGGPVALPTLEFNKIHNWANIVKFL